MLFGAVSPEIGRRIELAQMVVRQGQAPGASCPVAVARSAAGTSPRFSKCARGQVANLSYNVHGGRIGRLTIQFASLLPSTISRLVFLFLNA